MTDVDPTTLTVAGPADIRLLRPFVERLAVNGFLRKTRGGQAAFSLGVDDGESIEFAAAIPVIDPALADAVERELRLILGIED